MLSLAERHRQLEAIILSILKLGPEDGYKLYHTRRYIPCMCKYMLAYQLCKEGYHVKNVAEILGMHRTSGLHALKKMSDIEVNRKYFGTDILSIWDKFQQLISGAKDSAYYIDTRITGQRQDLRDKLYQAFINGIFAFTEYVELNDMITRCADEKAP